MSRLPLFAAASSRCRKCDAQGAATTYRPEINQDGVVVRIEHFERQCKRCGFRWAEAPLSAAPIPRPPGGSVMARTSVRVPDNVTESDHANADRKGEA